MNAMNLSETQAGALGTPVRNRYFYGKLLDVFHFELETSYMNEKRWLLNRLMSDYGVVCGLDVLLSEDGKSVTVTPGLAIDQLGREIIVPVTTAPLPIPEVQCPQKDPDSGADAAQSTRGYGRQLARGKASQEEEEEDIYFTVALCYNECQTQPTTVFIGGCGDSGPCAAGTIEERYKIEIRPGKTPEIEVWNCTIEDAVIKGELKYDVLARWVTDYCPVPDKDLCIPLANLRIRCDDGDACVDKEEGVDIAIRPVVLSNRSLFYLITSLLYDHGQQRSIVRR